MSLLVFYLYGVLLLLSAILLNVVSGKCGIMGWYDLLMGLSREGRPWLRRLRVIDYAWLLFAYPFLLGLACQLCRLLPLPTD